MDILYTLISWNGRHFNTVVFTTNCLERTEQSLLKHDLLKYAQYMPVKRYVRRHKGVQVFVTIWVLVFLSLWNEARQ